MRDDLAYEPLTPKTLPERLKNLDSITSLIGKEAQEWRVKDCLLYTSDAADE